MDKINSKPFAILRIIFGAVWLIDSALKWNSGFLNNFSSYLGSAAQGQPRLISDWIGLWLKIINLNPHFFALAVVIIEAAIGLGLVLGLFTKTTIAAGIILSLLIWTTAEGFGGPYAAGATDIGAAIIYVFVFLSLWFGRAWECNSLDAKFFNYNG